MAHGHPHFARRVRVQWQNHDLRRDFNRESRYDLQLHSLLADKDISGVAIGDRTFDQDPTTDEIKLEDGPKRRRPKWQPEGHIRVNSIASRVRQSLPVNV